MPSISYTVDASAAQRMAVAYGIALSLGREATLGEVKAEIARQTKEFVKHIERKVVAPPADFDMT